jgi:transposase
MNRKKESQIIYDREVLGLSYRNLGVKYGIDHMTAYRVIMRKQRKQEKQQEELLSALPSDLPDDIKLLKEELRKAKLKVELQDIMIDIASKELGVDIRKKSGTRQSE